jgi:hypothetical protein
MSDEKWALIKNRTKNSKREREKKVSKTTPFEREDARSSSSIASLGSAPRDLKPETSQKEGGVSS